MNDTVTLSYILESDANVFQRVLGIVTIVSYYYILRES